MKSRILLVVVAVGFLLSFGGCKKTSEELLGSFSAKIGGVAWESSLDLLVGTRYSNYLSIGGTDINGKKILIVIRGTEAKTYNFSLLEGQAGTYATFMVKNSDNTNTEYFTTQGTFTISSITENRVSGTFSFKAATTTTPIQTIDITEGTFSNILLITAK